MEEFRTIPIISHPIIAEFWEDTVCMVMAAQEAGDEYPKWAGVMRPLNSALGIFDFEFGERLFRIYLEDGASPPIVRATASEILAGRAPTMYMPLTPELISKIEVASKAE
jgi:hypothetical protein